MEHNLRILIVEDEPILAFHLEDELADAGHQVVGCAMSADEARNLATSLSPDLVLMDVALADGMTGVEVARDLARKGGHVVFVTASDRALPGDMAGAVGVIQKPFSSHGLRAAMGFLGRALGEGVPPPPPPSLRLAPHCVPGDNGLYCFA
jgi:DNA-binding response OmpR family regulator